MSKPNQTRTDLVEHIDVAALSLAAAGIDLPSKMDGRDILASDYQPKEFVFGARDRCGEAADRIRSVRSNQYLYIKNFYPQRPHLMPSSYKDGKLIVQRLRALHAAGELGELASKLMFAPSRPPEELYLYREDRWQIQNLAGDPRHADALERHRAMLNQWIERTGDPGPESIEVYRMETEDQIQSTRSEKTKQVYRDNIAVYERWFREGK